MARSLALAGWKLLPIQFSAEEGAHAKVVKEVWNLFWVPVSENSNTILILLLYTYKMLYIIFKKDFFTVFSKKYVEWLH